MLPRLPATVLFMAVFVAAAVRLLDTAAAQTALVPTQDAASLLGGERAQGAVIWSHGRSLETEFSLAPTPEYIGAFRAAGWDTFRLNRPRAGDTQPASGAALAEAAEALKHGGYRRVVLAGQSFGAFISLIAAGRSDAVDAVIGSAPAAYGSAQSNPGGFAQNATGLYDLLGAVRHAGSVGSNARPGGVVTTRAAAVDVGCPRKLDVSHRLADREAGRHKSRF